jgi:hypothetical protein
MASGFTDKIGQSIEIGDKFIKNNSTEIYQVIGFKDDGRLRTQEALLHFGGNPFAPSKPYGSTEHLIGPIYLFLPHQVQINKQWSK